MKKYTHAWLALKANQRLESFTGKFNADRNKHLAELLDFMSTYPSTFVRGAWFPDEVIKDNIQGGHTWKYFLDPVNGRVEMRRPPAQNGCVPYVVDQLNQKVTLDTKISDLPDRCEALSQSIRDMILITNKVKSGDVVAFNDSQVVLAFLMLAHYICDAHVPVHCGCALASVAWQGEQQPVGLHGGNLPGQFSSFPVFVLPYPTGWGGLCEGQDYGSLTPQGKSDRIFPQDPGGRDQLNRPGLAVNLGTLVPAE